YPPHRFPDHLSLLKFDDFHHHAVSRGDDDVRLSRHGAFRVAKEKESIADEKKEEHPQPGHEEPAQREENDQHGKNPSCFKEGLEPHRAGSVGFVARRVKRRSLLPSRGIVLAMSAASSGLLQQPPASSVIPSRADGEGPHSCKRHV